MLPSPFKWFNHLAASLERAAYQLLVVQGPPSETPLFDATVLATGGLPFPMAAHYAGAALVMNHLDGLLDDLDILAAPLTEVSR